MSLESDCGKSERNYYISINCITETMSKTCYLMEELPAQEWRKTLHFTLHFVAQTKAIGNMSMRHVLKPCSKAIHINIQSKADKPRGEALVELEAQRILFPKKQLYTSTRTPPDSLWQSAVYHKIQSSPCNVYQYTATQEESEKK